MRPPKKLSFIAQCQQVLAYIKSRSYSQLLWWMSGGRTVQQSLAPQSTSQRGATSGQNGSTHPQMFRSTVGQWFCCIKSLPQKAGDSSTSSSSRWSSSREACRHSDRNLVGGASDARHLLHPATLRLVGGTLRQCRAGISHSVAGGHADWVRGGGRGGAGGGGGEGVAAVGPTQRFHLDQLIPDCRKTQR